MSPPEPLVPQHLADRIAQLPVEKRAQLYEQLKKDRQDESSRSPIEPTPIPRQPRSGESYVLSFAQQRLWFLNQYEPESPEYNVPLGLRIRGALDPGILRRTLETIVDRHEVLRTTFTAVDGEPVQYLHDPAPVELDPVEADPEGSESPLEAALAHATRDARKPFDLERGPVLRSTLFRLGEGDHLLYLNVHHIAWDGWSQGIFLRELHLCYTALAEGGAAAPELPTQYVDFAAWQREWLEGEEIERQLAYWRGQLTAVPALELATDRPRPAVRTHDGTMLPVRLPAEVTGPLARVGHGASATLFMTLTAVLRALFHHYSGQRDFALGTLVANRTRPEIEGLIGFFSNTLALRTSLGGDPSLDEAVGRERRTALDAFAHQDLPFEKLVDELAPQRDLSRTAVFQAMLILHNAPGGSLELPGLELTLQSIDSRTSKLDLTLYLVERDGGLTGFFEYNTDLFDEATLERLADHLARACAAFGHDSARRLSELSLLGEEERRQLVVEWNDTDAEFPSELSIHGLFERQAARSPEDTAASCEGHEVSYAELDARANRLAHHLGARGVRQGTLVGVFLERSLDMLAAVLGVLKAGGAYLPLDPEYPEERLAFMLDDSEARVVVTQEDLVDKLSGAERTTVLVDRDRVEIAAWSAEPPEVTLASRQLAYVIYTSGSTGRPKGVCIPHRAVVNFLTSMARQPGIEAGDRLLAVTTLCFDIAGLELYLPLVTGARVEIASRETASAGEELLALMEDFAPTVMQATPATWRLLIDAGWQGRAELKVLCGGEALPPSLATELLPRCAELWNVYGPTEATIWSTVARL